MKILLVLITTFMMCLSSQASNGVAKVIKVRGKVVLVDSKKKIRKGDWLAEGAKIKTSARSFIKMVFIDKSKMSLGPNSQMAISKFPKKDAGIITLMKGQLRSQVSKNYMEIEQKNKSKLFIKTRTAAMGVRGTDFQVNYNPINKNTSLITFEGRVAMGAINKRMRKIQKSSQKSLERIVSSPTAVMVTKGQFSGVMPSFNSKPSSPIKINSKQIKALENNDGSSVSKEKETTSKSTKKISRSILPPGVNSNEFTGASQKELFKEIVKVDQNITEKIEHSSNKDVTKSVNTTTTYSTHKEGGYVDTKTLFYIPPPNNAAVDPITKEVIMPDNLGRIDSSTGEIKDALIVTTHQGQYKVDTLTDNSTTRSPASEEGTIQKNTEEALPEAYIPLGETLPDSPIEGLTDQNLPSKDFECSICDTLTDKRDDLVEDIKDSLAPNPEGTTRVNFETN